MRTALNSYHQPVPRVLNPARVGRFWGLLAGLWLGLLGPALAQLQLVPIIPFETQRPTPSPLRVTALRLPFFDDFSTARGGQPDPTLWQTGGGTYINNTLAINHPSVNVATFDGLDANGTPYYLGATNISGPTDTLTSQPIDLGGLSPADSVYLSFHWQSKGLGELPDDDDTLQLQFRTSAGTWQTVWSVTGGKPGNNFTQTLIPVRNAAFLHGNFQFRFRTAGRQTGAYDTWNLDYLYLNRGRNFGDRSIRDIACRQAVTPLLKRYTAMPLSHYLVNPAAETADTIRTDIVNLANTFNFTSFRFTVRDLVSGRLLQDTPQPQSQNIGAFSAQPKVVRLQPLPADLSGRAVLQARFDVLTTDDQNPSIPTVNLRRNDTISGYTVLDNYFAYDDGTAEFGAQINQRQGRVAMRFVLSKPDVVSAVRMSIVPFRTNLTGSSFVLSLYENTRGRPGRVLYQRSYALRYPSSRNGFVEFPFEYGVSVRDTFFVGWTQVSEDNLLTVGFDKNSPFGNQVFTNLSSTWDPSPLTGVPMMRPVLGTGGQAPVTGVEEEALGTLRVYPNPTQGIIQWDQPGLSQIEVLDPAGRLLRTIPLTEGQRQADLSAMPDGWYLLRLKARGRERVQKIILRK